MIHRYPAQVKAFYMEPDAKRPELALCVDVLAPEGYGEIIGGSQRMASYELLLKRIHEHGPAVVSGYAPPTPPPSAVSKMAPAALRAASGGK